MNSLPLIILLALVVVPPVVVLGVRLVLIAVHRGVEPEPPPNARPIFRSRRNRWILYSGLAVYGLAIVVCFAWWAAVDLAPRLGIRVSAPFIAWGIVWIIIVLAYMVVPVVLRIRRLLRKVPPPSGPQVSKAEKDDWRDRYLDEYYAGNTLKSLGKLLLGVLAIAVLMGLSAWIVSLFES